MFKLTDYFWLINIVTIGARSFLPPLFFYFILFTNAAAATRSTCEEERLRALELDRVDPEGHIFVPECESSSGGVLFRRAQCHNSTGYCWCVDERSGIPIPGISTHNATPDCSDINTRRLKGQRMLDLECEHFGHYSLWLLLSTKVVSWFKMMIIHFIASFFA